MHNIIYISIYNKGFFFNKTPYLPAYCKFITIKLCHLFREKLGQRIGSRIKIMSNSEVTSEEDI